MNNVTEQLRRIFEEIVLGFEALLEVFIGSVDKLIEYLAELFKDDMVRLFTVYFIFLLVYLFV